MVGRESVVRALKELNKGVDWDDPSAAARYSNSIWDENDRGVIILNGSAIEEVLERQIKTHMPHLNAEEASYLFGFNGPIGTFSGKIRMAHAMGLISRQIFRKIDLVREMRNTGAHSREPISFLTPAIRDATICLVHDLGIEVEDEADNENVRKAFMLVCVLLMMTALSGSVTHAHTEMGKVLSRNPPPTSPETPDE